MSATNKFFNDAFPSFDANFHIMYTPIIYKKKYLLCHELQASIHFFELSISTNDFHYLLNAFPQILHLCGFSLVWMILCRQRVEACLKPLWHTLQTKGRAPRNTVIHIIQRWKPWKVLYRFCYFSAFINLFSSFSYSIDFSILLF